MAEEHNYVLKIYALWESGALPRDAGLHQVTVCHDDVCGIYRQQRCDCALDIELARS